MSQILEGDHFILMQVYNQRSIHQRTALELKQCTGFAKHYVDRYEKEQRREAGNSQEK